MYALALLFACGTVAFPYTQRAHTVDYRSMYKDCAYFASANNVDAVELCKSFGMPETQTTKKRQVGLNCCFVHFHNRIFPEEISTTRLRALDSASGAFYTVYGRAGR